MNDKTQREHNRSAFRVDSDQAARLICPTGTTGKFLSSRPRKNILIYRISDLAQIAPIPPRLRRGVSRSSRNVRRGCGGRKGAVLDEQRRRGRRNRVVLAPQRSGAKLPTMLAHRGDDGGKRDGSPRRARISRKPPRREGRLSPPVPVVHALAQIFFARAAPGAAATRPSLRPLCLMRVRRKQSSGETRRENAGARLSNVVLANARTHNHRAKFLR
jgi:hypothetical protein